MAGGQWRCALCHHRRTRPAAELRQNRSAPDRVGAAFRQLPGGRRLAIQATELHELATEPDTLGRWAPVVTDLAQQYATAQRLSNTDPTRRAPGPCYAAISRSGTAAAS
ncbi:MAG TPA: hypothetical protein VE673_00145 [Pseudonocardiaceae bacterium]|nr:hypothetical protein [Pseudonocardiaceae bacterium]